MALRGNNLLNPSVCLCLPNSHGYNICKKIKWSTLSISSALLIISIYLSSGLYALIDATTMTSIKSHNGEDSMSHLFLWSISSSSSMSILGWTSVSIYFTVVLLITVLLCGIQLRKPWILFVWSIVMIFMLLGDGVLTVLSLREHQQQNYRSMRQIKILFFVMSVRLIVALCGIFVTVFHFRRLTKTQSEQQDRQRMLDRYHVESPSSLHHDSCEHPTVFPYPSKDYSDELRMSDVTPPVSLPRAKVAMIEHHPISQRFHSSSPKTEFMKSSYQRIMNKQNNDDFRYNIPLHERFHQEQIHNTQNY